MITISLPRFFTISLPRFFTIENQPECLYSIASIPPHGTINSRIWPRLGSFYTAQFPLEDGGDKLDVDNTNTPPLSNPYTLA
jgi:hypothetical protein